MKSSSNKNQTGNSKTGYSAENLPISDFKTYLSTLKQNGARNFSDADCVDHLVETLPEKLNLIHKSLLKLLNVS